MCALPRIRNGPPLAVESQSRGERGTQPRCCRQQLLEGRADSFERLFACLSGRVPVHGERRMRAQPAIAGRDHREFSNRVSAACGDLGERHSGGHERRDARVPCVVEREADSRCLPCRLENVPVRVPLRPEGALSFLVLVELFAAQSARATGDVKELAACELDDVVLAGHRDRPPGTASVEDSGEQRPPSAHVGFLAYEPPTLLQPRLQHTRLVGPTSGGRDSLMDEDQLSLGVDVLLAKREELLGSHAGQTRREDERPVPRFNGIEEATGLCGRDPAAFPARAFGLQASIGGIDPSAKRRIDLDAVLTQRPRGVRQKVRQKIKWVAAAP
jgi:hypothetical protein